MFPVVWAKDTDYTLLSLQNNMQLFSFFDILPWFCFHSKTFLSWSPFSFLFLLILNTWNMNRYLTGLLFFLSLHLPVQIYGYLSFLGFFHIWARKQKKKIILREHWPRIISIIHYVPLKGHSILWNNKVVLFVLGYIYNTEIKKNNSDIISEIISKKVHRSIH